MSFPLNPEASKSWSRRKILQLGVGGLAVAGGAAGYYWSQQRSLPKPARIPAQQSADPKDTLTPTAVLRDFDYGTVKQENGRTIREFQIVVGTSTLQLNQAVSYITWNYNGRVPGPTLRAKAGDWVRVLFLNQGGHAHTMHFHGMHAAVMDGIRPVQHGQAFIYEFDAEPYGVHLYHCHIAPVARHIGKGLYGMFIIDPPNPRPPADEMVLVMGGYDTNNDQRNELYAFNALPDYYSQHPIQIYQNQLVRLYLLNMIEFDAAVTFHIHANFFRVYPTGRTLTPAYETDVITLGITERHILEFAYPFPGKYMFHPHQDPIAEAGCMGVFQVLPVS